MLTQEAHVVSLLDGQLQVARLVVELAPEVKVEGKEELMKQLRLIILIYLM